MTKQQLLSIVICTLCRIFVSFISTIHIKYKYDFIYENIKICNNKNYNTCVFFPMFSLPIMFIDTNLHNINSFAFNHEMGHIKNNHNLKLFVFKIFMFGIFVVLHLPIIYSLILTEILSFPIIHYFEYEADLYAVNSCSKEEIIIGISDMKDYKNDIYHPLVNKRLQFIKQKLLNKINKN